MDTAAQALTVAHDLYARADAATNGTSTSPTTPERPGYYKVVGIILAVSSGAFIGTSFVLKKVGLLRANEKYNEAAGEGYGYLKNAYWWSGMTLMILGELCNFVAYAFTDAILVTPLGALSVVITTILSAIFLKERLSMVGKVACFLCIVGSVVIVMNAPQESSVATIQQMQHFVITPGFLTYTGIILVGSVITALWAGPRWGKKNMLVYISICSWVGGLSVVCTQGLGSAIVAQANGTPQFNQWFTYVLLVFVIFTLVTEIIFLNKALNLFNAAMVTPTYYVYFTSTTIITSAILFRGFHGTVTSIVTVVMGFLIICSGVVLLQLSKSAKDVPDAAVFAGDLDQIHTIAEQEQPETEPKADAIRGTAAILRRISHTRLNMEVAELKRLHEEKMAERLAAVDESGDGAGGANANQGQQPVLYEWDGLRRRRTTLGSQRSRGYTASSRSTVWPQYATAGGGGGLAPPQGPFTPPPPTPHPPLGWSHMPTEEELAEDRSMTPAVLSSISGTIRGRARSILVPRHNNRGSHQPLPEEEDGDGGAYMTAGEHSGGGGGGGGGGGKPLHSPVHPVQLTEIAVPTQQRHSGYRRAASEDEDHDDHDNYYGGAYKLPAGQTTEYLGAAGAAQGAAYAASDVSSLAPAPPPHSARRQFSFQNVFRRPSTQQPLPGQHGTSAALAAAGLAAASVADPTTGEYYQQQHVGPSSSRSRQHHGRVPSLHFAGGPRLAKGATEEERLGLVKGDEAPALAPYDERSEEGLEGLDEEEEEDMVVVTPPPVFEQAPPAQAQYHPRQQQQQQQQHQERAMTSASDDSTDYRVWARHAQQMEAQVAAEAEAAEAQLAAEAAQAQAQALQAQRQQQQHARRPSSPSGVPPPAPSHRYSPPRGGGGVGGTGAFI